MGMEVYVLDLDTLRPRMEEALALLPPGRREKALRLCREDARLRSVGAGLLLRRFSPGDPEIAPGGKPFFPGGRHFSLTHSGALAAIALADRPVGLDAEAVRPVSPAAVRRTMGPEERTWLEARGEEGFAFLWTRKEAALKCLGTGVDRDLASICALPGRDLVLEGIQLSLHTVRRGAYTLSAACEGSADFVPETADIRELLKGV